MKLSQRKLVIVGDAGTGKVRAFLSHYRPYISPSKQTALLGRFVSGQPPSAVGRSPSYSLRDVRVTLTSLLCLFSDPSSTRPREQDCECRRE
jgi:hypothetical protein